MSFLESVMQPAAMPLRQAIAGLRPQLSLVPGGQRSRVLGDVGFAVLLLAISFAGVLVYLVAQTQLSQGAFDERQLTAQLRDSAAQVQELQQQATVLAAPATLDRRAREIGMVPMPVPVFLRLSDGAVLGKPKAASAEPASESLVVTLDAKQLGLAGSRAAQALASQRPVDDGAVLVSEANPQ